MIHYLDHDAAQSWNIPQSVKKIHTSPYQFYLGGSRRMHCIALHSDCPINITTETDYDLYATFSYQMVEFLTSNGFEPSTCSNYGYMDDEAVAIMVHTAANVQVVLRNNAELYNVVFENIDPKIYYHFLWKQNSFVDRAMIQPFFNTMFAVARSSSACHNLF